MALGVTTEETLPESDPAQDEQVDAPAVHALALVWSRDEPWRVGQLLLVPPGSAGHPITFGRGSAEAGDAHRGVLREHRFFQSNPAPPLGSPSISRTQLEIHASGGESVFIRNVGRCALLRNGVATTESDFRQGDTLQLGRQALFLVTKVPGSISGRATEYPEFAFGEPDPQEIVGESAAIWRLRAHIASIAPRAGHVLIEGPSGSGKELVARALHALSSRRDKRLVARSAATMPETLIDAELFGNCKNYPNPGMADRQGLVGEAADSTLFLDEIAELPHGSQAHLLRLLDRGEYHRLGESKPRQVDLRLVAATNREPSALKHDLLARLTLRVSVPSLDDRREDVPLLVRHILRSAAARGDAIARTRIEVCDGAREPYVGVGFMRQLVEHHYELGVRELETVLWRHLTSPSTPVLGANGSTHARENTQPSHEAARGADDRDWAGMDLDAARIQRCLDDNNGVVELAWRALGMKNRYVLIRAIKKYGLEVRRRPGQRPVRVGR